MTNGKDDKIVNLDAFRKNNPQPKKTPPENARFTADEERQLQAAFQYGSDTGALSEIKMEKGIQLSLCQFLPKDKNAPTLSVSKSIVLGDVRYTSDSSKKGMLECCGSFKQMLSSVYDFISDQSPENTATPKLKP